MLAWAPRHCNRAAPLDLLNCSAAMQAVATTLCRVGHPAAAAPAARQQPCPLRPSSFHGASLAGAWAAPQLLQRPRSPRAHAAAARGVYASAKAPWDGQPAARCVPPPVVGPAADGPPRRQSPPACRPGLPPPTCRTRAAGWCWRTAPCGTAWPLGTPAPKVGPAAKPHTAAALRRRRRRGRLPAVACRPAAPYVGHSQPTLLPASPSSRDLQHCRRRRRRQL